MADFTYEVPNETIFFKAVTEIAKHNIHYCAVGDFIKNGYCTISPTNNFSRKRWDAYSTEVSFYISQQSFYEHSNLLDAYSQTLKEICSTVMPANAGYDVMKVNISPILDSEHNNLLEEITNSINYSGLDTLSQDLLEKGKSMSEVYISLYCIENLLRNFIESVLIDSLGENYWNQCSISNDIKKIIDTRRNDETKNKWLPLRGDNNLFYLDFIELSKIITNNWECFKTYFPTQSWIATKIDELYKIRCLIAHNSYLGNDEKDCVKLYFKQIVKQMVVEQKKECISDSDDLPF